MPDVQEKPKDEHVPSDSWKPPGWDKDNSGYNKEDPASKASPAVAENNADTLDGNKSAASSSEKALTSGLGDTENDGGSDQVGKGFSATPAGRLSRMAGYFRGPKGRRRSATAGITATVGGFLVFGFVLFAPISVVEHMRSMSLERAGEFQTDQSIRYRRSRLAKIGDLFSADGRRGGAIIAEMELRGYRFVFDDVDKNKIKGLQPPGSSQTLISSNMGDEINEFLNRKHRFTSSRWKTKRMEAFYNRYGIPREPPTVRTANTPDDPEKALNKRLAQGIYGEDTEVKVNASSELDEDVPEDEASRRRAEVDDLARNGGDFGNIKSEVLENGTPIKQIDDPLVDTVAGLEGNIDDVTLRAVERSVDKGVTVSLATIRSLGTVDIADKICTIKNRLRAAVTASRLAKVIGLQNLAALTVILPSDALRVGSGNDSQLLNELSRRFTTADGAGQTVGASTVSSYLLKGTFSKSKNNDLKSTFGVDGKQSVVFDTIQDTTDSIPGTGKRACGVWQNPATQIGAGAVEVVAAVFSGGTSAAATNGAKASVRVAVNKVIKTVFSRQVAKSLGKTLAVELSFNGIIGLAGLYAEKALTFPVTGQDTGGTLEAQALTGALSMHKQRNLQAGFVPVTADVYGEALTAYNERKRLEIEQQSFFARMFDMNNPDSFVYENYLSLPHSGEAVRQTVASAASSLPMSVIHSPTQSFTSLANLITPGAYAQSSDEIAFDVYETEGDNSGIELATDPGGNLITYIPQEVADIDELENIDFLIAEGHISSSDYEPLSDTFKNHMENCVYSPDTISRIEGGNKDSAEDDCLMIGAERSLVARFKAHLLYLDFLDGFDADMFPGEIGGGAVVNTVSSVQAPGLNGYVVPCVGEPRGVERIESPAAEHADWTGIPDSGIIGYNSRKTDENGQQGDPIKVYIREACDVTNPKTVLIVSSIHGSENGGQFIGHELLYNETLPKDVRIIVVPELNKTGIIDREGGGAPRNRYFNTGRVNANAVNLNRNNDYRWESMNRVENTSTDGEFAGNYRGGSPASEPETQAINDFILSLGDIDLTLHYHDNLNYVGAAHSENWVPMARTYGRVAQMPVGNSGGAVIKQRGSLDGWQAATTSDPVLLVEMSSDLSQGVIDRHVNAVKAVVEENLR